MSYHEIDRKGLEKKAQGWIEELPFRKRWPGEIKMEETALLVIDMQKYFLSPGSHAHLPAGEAIIENLNDLIDLFDGDAGMIIYTKTIQEEGDEGVMGEWWSDIIREGPAAELDSRLEVKGDVIVKPRYSSFHRTDLEEKLEGVKNVVIGGVMTDMCCATTARDAFVRDFRVLFLADGTATGTETTHVSCLRSLCHGVAEISTCREIKERLL
ncbi:MAG: isochorismatase family protein [Candidatus Natronoplasma sp.]